MHAVFLWGTASDIISLPLDLCYLEPLHMILALEISQLSLLLGEDKLLSDPYQVHVLP